MFYKHGLNRTTIATTWNDMKARCNNPNNKSYKYYGGRGIKVCNRWQNSLVAFVSDMGDKPTSKHTIERIDVNGNYEPSNCRWATTKEQATNRRLRKSGTLTINGIVKTISAWAKENGLQYDTLKGRVRNLKGRPATPNILRPKEIATRFKAIQEAIK